MRKACTEAKGEGGLASDMGTCITTDMETPLYFHSVELAEVNGVCFLEGKGENVFRKLFLVWEGECVRSMSR